MTNKSQLVGQIVTHKMVTNKGLIKEKVSYLQVSFLSSSRIWFWLFRLGSLIKLLKFEAINVLYSTSLEIAWAGLSVSRT